ncbi:MAG: hypothetical protein WA609_20240, partial [Terriglobales bacterium]
QNPARRNVAKAVDRAGASGGLQKNAEKPARGTSAADVPESHIDVGDQPHAQDSPGQEIASGTIPPSRAGQAGPDSHASATARVSPPKRTRRSSGSGIAKGAALKSVASKSGANAGTPSSGSKAAGKSSIDATQPVVTPAAVAVADSNVEIQIESRFPDATLKIWIDDKLAYWHPLHDRKRRLLLLGGASKETLTLPVSSGTHAVRIEVRSAAEQYDETKTVDGDFLSGGDRSLSVSFDKHSKEMRVTLANR